MNRRNRFPESFVALLLMISSACARENAKAALKEFEFGPRRVQVAVPAGWEALDQGKQKRFRKVNSRSSCRISDLRLPHLATWTRSSTGDSRSSVTTSGAR